MLSEREYLDIVEREERALLGDRSVLADLISLDMPRLLADWREAQRLRTHDKEATDLTIDQQVEIGRLRAALERFGRHLVTCSYFRDGSHQASPETACDCGLTAACRT